MKKLIVANFKMNQNPSETKQYLTKFVAGFNGNRADVVICPSFVSLPVATFLASGSLVRLGAQNVSDEEEGSYTGEVSAQMLKDLGVEYVIIGHSDRRDKFKESDRLINKKIKTALKNGLKCIVCVGESLADRNTGKTFDVIRHQIEECVKGLYENELESVIIAYEPIWAIGTGQNASVKDVENAAKVIRKVIYESYSEKASRDIQVLYGGSLNEKNVGALLNCSGIDGGLFGKISLNVNQFLDIANNLK